MGPDHRSVFISSCTRRQLSRRKPSRIQLPLQLLVAALVLAGAVGALFAVRGGM